MMKLTIKVRARTLAFVTLKIGMHLIKLRTIQDKFPLNKSEAKGDFVILKL